MLQGEMMNKKVYWLEDAPQEMKSQKSTWYRCVGIEDFVTKICAKDTIYGIIFDDNNIGFILKD